MLRGHLRKTKESKRGEEKREPSSHNRSYIPKKGKRRYRLKPGSSESFSQELKSPNPKIVC